MVQSEFWIAGMMLIWVETFIFFFLNLKKYALAAALKRFNSLKTGKKTKTLIAVGGWNEGSITFSQVCAEPGLRKNFVQSALTLVQTYGFDGFDLDWEYPARRGGSSADKVSSSQQNCFEIF